MRPIVVETVIARSPEETFAYMRDYSNEAIWQAEHVKDVIVEPPGPAQVGTRLRKVRRTPSGDQRFTEEVMEMDEAALRWTDMTITGPFRGTTGSWQVLRDAEGARVRIAVKPHAHGLWRLLLPFVGRTMRRDLQAEFSTLKGILESSSGD